MGYHGLVWQGTWPPRRVPAPPGCVLGSRLGAAVRREPAALRHAAMRIEPFSLERWMTRHETRVRYDLAESGIHPLCVGDLLGWLPGEERGAALAGLLEMRLGYSEACGTLALRTLIARALPGCAPPRVRAPTGGM